MPELLQDYKAQHGRLVAQARELERLRQQVRSSAEREAAAIVTNARRNVRQVLLDARQELLVLVAQLQAVGCDQPGSGSSRLVMEGELADQPETLTSAAQPAVTAEHEPEPAAGGIAAVARRDVREVLLEAQAELLALAEEARELRARIAKQHGLAVEAAPAVEQSPPEQAPADQTSVVDEEPSVREESAPEEPAGPVATPAEYVPLASGSRLWIPVAAALAVAAIGTTVYVWSGARVASAHRDDSAGVDVAASPGTPARNHDAPAPVGRPAAAPLDPSKLSLTIDVRRPAWIRTTVDGRTDVGRLFNPGETRTLTASQEIVMRAGDAGAVFVSVNGSEPKPLGMDGRAMTRRFGRAPVREPQAFRAALPTEAVPPAPLSGTPAVDIGTTGTTTDAPPQTSSPAASEREILRVTQQWFEAYFAGNTTGMKDIASTEFQLVDERGAEPPVPPTMRGVERGLQQVRIELAGDGAVMSARLVERANVNGQPREHVSLVSGVWIRSEGRWRLASLRFVNPARVSPDLR